MALTWYRSTRNSDSDLCYGCVLQVQIHGDVRLDTDIIALHVRGPPHAKTPTQASDATGLPLSATDCVSSQVPKSQDSAKLKEFAKKNRLQYIVFKPELKGCVLETR